MTRTLGIALLAVAACTSSPSGIDERAAIPRELTYDVIVPALYATTLEASRNNLTLFMRRFAAMTTPTRLGYAQTAWRDARSAWKRTEAFGFGPALDYALADAIDGEPVDGPAIEVLIAGTGAIDEASVSELPHTMRGYHALEYLLFSPDGDNNRVLEQLLDPTTGTRRLRLLVAVSADLVSHTEQLRLAWDDDYTAVFSEPGVDNPTFPDVDAVIDLVIGRSVEVLGRLATTRIGAPAGLDTGTIRPEFAESARSDNSLADLRDSLAGVAIVYLGRDDTGRGGLARLVAARDPAADAAMRAALGAAATALAAIPTPYAQAMRDRRPELAIARDALQAIQRVWIEDVAPALR